MIKIIEAIKYEILIFCLAAFYLYLLYLLQNDEYTRSLLMHVRINPDAIFIHGIIGQGQLFLTVILALMRKQYSIYVAFLLNILGLMGSVRYIMVIQKNNAIPGIMSYTSAIVIVIIIFVFKHQIRSHIFELEEAQKKLKQMAYFDGLTGVLNRNTFLEALEVQVQYYSKVNRKFFMVFMDIDNFKQINDTYGHQAGDTILKETVKRIQSVMYEEDVIGRIGGDELGLIIDKKMELSEVKEYLEHLKTEIIKPYILDGVERMVTVSIGVSAFPTNGNNAEEILKKADLSMYQAKMMGKNTIHYFYEESEYGNQN